MSIRGTTPRNAVRSLLYRASLILILFHVAALTGLAQHTIFVDDDGPANGNGTPWSPFNNIPAAIEYANTVNGPSATTIHVQPGRYEISDTLRIESAITIQGANDLEIDSQGWPTGNLLVPSNETRIVGTAALLAKTLIEVGKTGQVIHDVKLRGLTIEGGPGDGNILDFSRVQGFEVRDSILMGSTLLPTGSGSGINTFASSGTIRDTYTTRLLGAAFMGAGYPGSPAEVTFRNNRAVQNRAGIFLVGTDDGITEPGDQLHAVVRDNDLSDNNNQRASVGIRILIKGREDLGPGYGKTGLSTGNIQATIRNNRLVGNRVGIAIDAGFATRRVPPPPPNVCDTRTFTGSLDLSLRDNTIANSALRSAVVSFTQFQRALDSLEGLPVNFSQSQYLHNTNYTIDDPDNALEGRFTDHPVTDPFVGGTCILDSAHEQLNNVLQINGSPVTPAP